MIETVQIVGASGRVGTAMSARLQERGVATKRYKKPTNTRPAPLPLQQQIATEVSLVVEGLSD